MLSINDSLLLLGRYETIPICGVLVTKSGSARMTSTLRVLEIHGLPHVRIGGDANGADRIEFCLSGCKFSYSDLREPKAASAESAAHNYEGSFLAESPSGDVLGIYESRSL